MEFQKTAIEGVFLVASSPLQDERGHFVRTFCRDAFQEHGLELPIAQMALSFNKTKGTLRGLHCIPEAQGEAKLVRCTKGSVFDVAVDLRANSRTFGQWIATELSPSRFNAFFLPKGMGHGFLTLEDETEIAYQFSEMYRPGIEQGVLWKDADIGVAWPFEPTLLSDRDSALPALATSVFAK